MKQGVQGSAKARHQRAKKLIDISNAMVLEAAEKDLEYGERMLIIPLCLAERAWAYAMQLKQETGEQPRKRFHLVRRLKKASIHAERFQKLCLDPESPCSDRTKQESIAYASYVTGLYNLERENWAEAKQNLHRALIIYYTLSVSIRNNEVLEHYHQRIDELKASLKYCVFSLGDQVAKESVGRKRVELPATLQFHDLAFRHAEKLNQEKMAAKAAKAEAKKLEPAKTTTRSPPATSVSKQQEQKSESPKKVVETKESPGTKKDIKPPADAAAPAPKQEAEEEEDEFDEAQEGMVEESEEETDSDEETDDDDKPQQTGGVTGLVKGWLGGAWSRG